MILTSDTCKDSHINSLIHVDLRIESHPKLNRALTLSGSHSRCLLNLWGIVNPESQPRLNVDFTEGLHNEIAWLAQPNEGDLHPRMGLTMQEEGQSFQDKAMHLR